MSTWRPARAPFRRRSPVRSGRLEAMTGLGPRSVYRPDQPVRRLACGHFGRPCAQMLLQRCGDVPEPEWRAGRDDTAEATIAASLAEQWDCIVIGAGYRHAVKRVAAVRAGHQRRSPRRPRHADRVQHLAGQLCRCGRQVVGWRLDGFRRRSLWACQRTARSCAGTAAGSPFHFVEMSSSMTKAPSRTLENPFSSRMRPPALKSSRP